MGELLDYVRAAAPKADHPGYAAAVYLFALLSEKALAFISLLHFVSRRFHIGDPTTENSEMRRGTRERGCQQSPAIESLLKMIAPCIN